MSEVEVKPLSRMGAFDLKEVKSGRTYPPRLVSPGALEACWREMVDYWLGLRAWRQRSFEQEASESGASSASRARYSNKISTKAAEAALALLHGILAPEAKFLCDEECPHMRAGATADQLRRALDSIDAAVNETQARMSGYSYELREDCEDELQAYRWIRVRLADASEPVPA